MDQLERQQALLERSEMQLEAGFDQERSVTDVLKQQVAALQEQVDARAT